MTMLFKLVKLGSESLKYEVPSSYKLFSLNLFKIIVKNP